MLSQNLIQNLCDQYHKRLECKKEMNREQRKKQSKMIK